MSDALFTVRQPCGCPVGEGHRCDPPFADLAPAVWLSDRCRVCGQPGAVLCVVCGAIGALTDAQLTAVCDRIDCQRIERREQLT